MSIESLEHIVRNRVRMFLRHTWLVAVLGTAIIGGSIWWAFYVTTAPTILRVAAGPPGSIDVSFVELLTRKLAEEHDQVRLEFISTSGPQESAQKIADGAVDLAILPSTAGDSLVWPVVAILRQNVMALIVPPAPPPPAPPPAPVVAPAKKEAAPPPAPTPAAKKEAGTKTAKGSKNSKNTKADKPGKAAASDKVPGGDKNSKNAKADDSDADDDSTDAATKPDAAGKADADSKAEADNKLEKVTQLAGHRIGIVTGSAATPELLNDVLKHYGVPGEKVAVSLIDPKNLADAVKVEQIDAIFVAGAPTGAAISEAVAAAARDGRAPGFIAIDQADGIAKRNRAFDSADIDAGTFGGNPPSPDDTLKTLSFAEYLVARKSLNRDAIGALAKLIFTSRLAFAAAMPGEIKIAAPPTEKDASVVVHPGALAYLTDDQKSFFDKYGDDIFYGLLIFPVFGSALAAVAGYFRHNGRTRRLRLLQRLIDFVRKARAAPSLQALDQMQADVDQTVIAIIHQSEHEEYDQTVQMSFSLVLDQVRFAIAGRRAILVEEAGRETKRGGNAAAA